MLDLKEYKALVRQYTTKSKDPNHRAFCGVFQDGGNTFVGIIIDESKRKGTPLQKIIMQGHECIIKRLDSINIIEIKEFLDTYLVKE